MDADRKVGKLGLNDFAQIYSVLTSLTYAQPRRPFTQRDPEEDRRRQAANRLLQCLILGDVKFFCAVDYPSKNDQLSIGLLDDGSETMAVEPLLVVPGRGSVTLVAAAKQLVKEHQIAQLSRLLNCVCVRNNDDNTGTERVTFRTAMRIIPQAATVINLNDKSRLAASDMTRVAVLLPQVGKDMPLLLWRDALGAVRRGEVVDIQGGDFDLSIYAAQKFDFGPPEFDIE